jgi:hypothetical protein
MLCRVRTPAGIVLSVPRLQIRGYAGVVPRRRLAILENVHNSLRHPETLSKSFAVSEHLLFWRQGLTSH